MGVLFLLHASLQSDPLMALFLVGMSFFDGYDVYSRCGVVAHVEGLVQGAKRVLKSTKSFAFPGAAVSPPSFRALDYSPWGGLSFRSLLVQEDAVKLNLFLFQSTTQSPLISLLEARSGRGKRKEMQSTTTTTADNE